jgi:hypothetical protein
MEERRKYPPAAMRWNIEAENHGFAAIAFHAIVAGNASRCCASTTWTENGNRYDRIPWPDDPSFGTSKIVVAVIFSVGP